MAGRLSLLAGVWLLALVALFLTVGGGQARAAVVMAGKDGTLSQPVTLASKTLPTGTPAPGTTVPVGGTSTPLGASTGGTVTPTSDEKTALKDGVIAAGLGLLALLALVGVITFFLPRLRGSPDLAKFSKANARKTSSSRRSGGAGQRFMQRRSGPSGGSQGRRDTSAPPRSGRPNTRRLDPDEALKPIGAASSAKSSNRERYPWQRPGNGPLGLSSSPRRRELPADQDKRQRRRSGAPSPRPPQD